jgi:outer membrane protein assembly factor BamB
VTYACAQDYDFAPSSGQLIWHHAPPCSGGGGKTPVLAGGAVYARDSGGNLILSADSGQTQGSFSSAPAPAVGAGRAFMVDGGALTASSQSGLGPDAWTFTGDSHLDTAPLLVDSLVFEGSSSGEIYAVDAATGTTVWSANVGASIPGPDEQNVSSPLTGLAAGEGTLVIPAGSMLTAYASASLGTSTPSNSQAPTVLGPPAIGRPIGVDVGQWSSLVTAYTYQWQRCDGSGAGCAPIAGANGEAYTPTSSDAGSTFRVTVTATDASGTSGPVSSAASVPVTPTGPPMNTAAPSVTGTPTVGQTLAADPGTWAPAATRYSYQWFSCPASSPCRQIIGATGSSYTLTSNEAAKRIKVEVTAVNSFGGSDPADSSQTAPVSSGGRTAPVVTRVALTSSKNPARAGDAITFTATITPAVDGGTITFTENGLPLTGCTSGQLNASMRTVTCTVSAAKAATLSIRATYSGDGSHAGSSATLTQAIKSAMLPPEQHVGQKRGEKTRGRQPNFALTLTAVRTQGVAHWFAAENVTCMGGAGGVQITIGSATVTVPCKASLALASKRMPAHRTYKIAARAVRYDKKHRIIARGPYTGCRCTCRETRRCRLQSLALSSARRRWAEIVWRTDSPLAPGGRCLTE